jgi:hypothetical protein
LAVEVVVVNTTAVLLLAVVLVLVDTELTLAHRAVTPLLNHQLLLTQAKATQ